MSAVFAWMCACLRPCGCVWVCANSACGRDQTLPQLSSPGRRAECVGQGFWLTMCTTAQSVEALVAALPTTADDHPALFELRVCPSWHRAVVDTAGRGSLGPWGALLPIAAKGGKQAVWLPIDLGWL